MIIEIINQDKRDEALKLILDTFMEFEAPDYSDEGVKSFINTVIYNDEFLSNIVMYGAYEDEILKGIIASRNNGNHIALFFVDGKYQRQGIGKKLFLKLLQNRKSDEITVNSSPFATKIYHHLGFVDTDNEQEIDGIKFTPMKYIAD